MKKIAMVLLLALTFMTTSIVISNQVQADVEWNTLKEIDLKTEALDVATSPDEQVLFLLSRREVLIYSLREDKVIERIPLDKEFEKLNYLPRTNALVLTSTSKKNLQIIKMEFIQNFDITELPYRGPENAPVTVVSFNDYQWPYCARLEPTLQQVLEKYPKEVKVVFKNLPIQSHAFARKAAEGALAASRQGKFVEFHGKLFANQKSLNDGKIREIAQEVGLNLDQFERDMKDSRLGFLIDRDIRQAQQTGVRATPTVFVNGKLLRNISIQGFQQAIEAELSKRK